MILTCAYCGIDFERPKAHAKKSPRHFCGQKCYGLAIRKRQTFPCEVCGKPAERTPSRLEMFDHIFCGRECSTIFHSRENHPMWNGGRVDVNCASCGKALTRQKCEVENCERFFCDLKCRGKWMSEHNVGENHPNFKGIHIVKCSFCGVEIERPKWWFEQDSEYSFCNKQCMGNYYAEHFTGNKRYNWKGGRLPYYGPSWFRQRRKARKRDKFTCQRCGKSEKKNGQALDVHHIIPFREFAYVVGENENYKKANRLSNLISLCMSCHKLVECGTVSVQLP